MQEGVLELLSSGVIVLNDVLRPVVVNRAARRLLELDPSSASPPDAVMSVARQALATKQPVEEVVDVWGPERMSVRVEARLLDEDRGVLLGLSDISAETRALRVRRQFVAHASHELKSPVAGIQALAEAIVRAARDDPRRTEEFAEKLLSETARVAKLISDLLDLSRIEDPASFSTAAVDLSELSRREAHEISARAEAKRLRLGVEVEDDVWTQGDEQQLLLLIRNLLDNAIRYTPEGGCVELRARRENGHAVISVTDDGIGIPLKAQARVFERFYRVDEGRSRDHGGTGLGLAIVRHVADLYGGRVEVESQFGEGATFTAYLPVVEAPARRDD